MSKQIDPVLAYHQATKHHFHRFARGPGRLDWAIQPDPFRRYQGATLFPLEHAPPGQGPPYAIARYAGKVPPSPLIRHSVSKLVLDSLAISAWKRAGDVARALRINPSSGNLHPTESYLLCRAMARQLSCDQEIPRADDLAGLPRRRCTTCSRGRIVVTKKRGRK